MKNKNCRCFWNLWIKTGNNQLLALNNCCAITIQQKTETK